MDNLSQILEQGQRFVEQHVPVESYSAVVPTAILIGVAGVLISVLGTRLVRPALTVGFCAAGAWAAARFVQIDVVPQPVVMILAIVLAGVCGYFLYRLWVGAGAAVLMAVIGLSVFGAVRILPEVGPFEESNAIITAEGVAEFALPTPEEQQEFLERSPEKWARDFWAHLTDKQADVEKHLAVIGAAAAFVGLLLGMFATRATLIVSTSLVGTALVASGALALVAWLTPEVYRSALESPRLLGGAGAGLLLTSVILQALLNRRPPPTPVAQPEK